ncbi:hypothetical protein [Marisediminicola senii]|uniref:hypothetical protein n=1 Tax=Marisediminicola senii TaxID=2711233 RepID=UPI0013EB957C|nr:hypothetical protein [Marisediminicola senii]
MTDAIRAKWLEFAGVVNKLVLRVADPDDFAVEGASSLSGDDKASHPFEVSHAIRHLINASVDQLDGIRVLLADAEAEHLAVGSTLARAALENAATALWILGPDGRHSRDRRVERVLRWHARNYHDEQKTVGHLVGDAPKRHLEKIYEVATRRKIDADAARSGYKATKPITECAEFTTIDVNFLWSVASGFAHGRPWAYRGLLERRTLRVDDDGHSTELMSPRKDLAIWLPFQAVHLLGEVMRLRDRRAGLAMPAMPDGSPDSSPR